MFVCGPLLGSATATAIYNGILRPYTDNEYVKQKTHPEENGKNGHGLESGPEW